MDRDKVRLYAERTPQGVLAITDGFETAIGGFGGPVLVDAHLYDAWRRVVDISEGVVQSIEVRDELPEKAASFRPEKHAKVKLLDPEGDVNARHTIQQAVPDLDELEEQIDPTAGGFVAAEQMGRDIQAGLMLAVRAMDGRTFRDDPQQLSSLCKKYHVREIPPVDPTKGGIITTAEMAIDIRNILPMARRMGSMGGNAEDFRLLGRFEAKYGVKP